jgi:hypothetical protein
MERRFELRQGDSVVGRLTQPAKGDVTLMHNLTEAQLRVRPTVDVCDELGKILHLKSRVVGREVEIAFFDEGGKEQLGIAKNDAGFLDVNDPKQQAWLRLKLTGPGAIGDAPIRNGVFALELTPFDPEIPIYRHRVEQLYAEVREWLKGSALATGESVITLREGIYGPYYVPILVILDAEARRAAMLEPAGSSIIGACGRVDIVGNYDRQSVLYLAAGSGSNRVFKNVTVAGWYWIEEARLGRVRQLDQTLFMDLLKEVTDLHEF